MGARRRYSWAPDTVRDAVFFVVFLVSSLHSTQKAPDALPATLRFSLVYLAGNSYLYLQANHNLRQGHFGILPGARVPGSHCTAVTIRPRTWWRRRKSTAPERSGGADGDRAHHLRGLPAARLLMAAGLAEKQLGHRQLPGVFLILLFRCENSICGAQQSEAARALEESNDCSIRCLKAPATRCTSRIWKALRYRDKTSGLSATSVRDVIGKTTGSIN